MFGVRGAMTVGRLGAVRGTVGAAVVLAIFGSVTRLAGVELGLVAALLGGMLGVFAVERRLPAAVALPPVVLFAWVPFGFAGALGIASACALAVGALAGWALASPAFAGVPVWRPVPLPSRRDPRCRRSRS